MSEQVTVTLCVGLVGVCIISIESETDGVYEDINNNGVESWYEELPEHDGPLQGIYKLEMSVSFEEHDIFYEINDVVVDEQNKPHPDFLLELSKQLNEQDNRITADPLFCVYYDEKVPTSEDYSDDFEWFDHEESEVIGDDDDLIEYLKENHLEWLQNYATGEEVEVSDVTIDDLEWETLPSKIDKVHYLKKKHFVKASLTEAGAQQFIDRKQHDYSPLYIYAESMCYQWQMIELRKWLLSLHKVQGE